LHRRLYIPKDRVEVLLADLIREDLVSVTQGNPQVYGYNSVSIEQDQMIASVDATYRREVVRVATLIHSRPPSSLRDFARAFRFKKDRE
jgi:hypothetical protein